MLSIGNQLKAQYKVEGYIYDKNTNSPLPHTVISLNSISRSADSTGYFSFEVKRGKYSFLITRLGYETIKRELEVQKSVFLREYLISKSSMMKDVIVTSRTNGIPQSSPVASEISGKDLEKVPVFLGQRDPIRTLQTLPGTGKGGDGNAGFFVRGGTSGQNLTLLNHATIYNPSHLLGFFSVFNGDAVNNIKLYKSGIPSEYGGRLSSVLEVSTANRISDSLSFKGNVSLLGADASLTVPVTSNWSVNASLRKTYMGLTVWPLVQQLSDKDGSFSNTKYDFYDAVISSNLKLNATNFITFSSFFSGDNFNFSLSKFNISNTMDWYNSAHSLSWKSFIRSNFYVNTLLTYTTYKFDFGMLQDKYQAGVHSNIRDYSVKSFATYTSGKHELKAGLEYLNHRYKPNSPFAKTGGIDYDFGIPNTYYSTENSVFVSDEIKVSDKIGIYAGGRYTLYQHVGPYTVVSDNEQASSFKRGETVSRLGYFEPTFQLNYAIKKNAALKFSLSHNTQPVHLISVTAVNFPTDFWMPSVGNLKPQKGTQASLGLFADVVPKKYEGSIDFYYKKMTGLAEFSGGIMNLLDNLKIEDNLYFGKGNTYGAEVFLKKKSGNLTGWISYTWSKNNRNFELINEGKTFPAKYDRRHDLSIISAYKLNHKWELTGAFTYATGNTYTKPVSRYILSGNIINEYGKFNGSRMPAYHRMDLSGTYLIKSNLKSRKELIMSVYNIYSRPNPIYIYFMAKGDLDSYQVSVTPKSVSILPILPSISYRYTFK